MATKTITGAYPGGYYLKPAYTTLDIAATAVIGGTGIQASSSQASTIDNAGTIAPTGAGIVLLDGGAVTNENSGRIAGGVAISGQSGAVTNAGVVTGNSYTLSSSGTITRHQQASVVLAQGGTVTNAAGGDLAGGVSIRGVAGAVANYGTIGGPQTSTVTGGGTVTTTYASVALLHGGSVVNGSATDASATLTQGISLVGAGTITNFGVIGSTSAGVSAYLSGAGDVFIEEGSGVIDGSILCVATSFPTGLLELAADDGAGTISGLGSSITGFANVEVKSGGTWTLAGANTIVAGETLTNAADLVDDGTLTNGGAVVLQAAMRLATNAEIDNVAGAFMTLVAGAGVLAAGGATGLTLVNAGVVASPGGSSPAEIAADVVNTGSVLTDGGVLNIDGAVSGAGAWRIGADATLDLHNAVAAGATIAFAGEDGLATIGDAAGFAGTIAHFASTDSLDVTGATIDLSTVALNAKTKLSWSDEGTYGVLTVTDGTRTAHVAFAGRYDTASFTLKSDGGSGLDLGFVATTTTLTGKYSGDYDLASAFDAVTVTASGTIVGELSTSARGPVSITNLGNIGTVALADGSALLNESQCGGVSGTGDVTNYGSIKASGDNAGVSIQGNLQNFGVITGGAYSHTSGNYTYEQKSLYGVIVSFGTVENGSLSDENVTIVGVELYRSTLHNYGTLVGTAINGVGYYGDLYQSTSYSAVLYGGTIFNGSSSDKTATIASGLEFGRSSSGTMFNYGTIDARFASENGISDSLYAVYFRGTGTVVNGGPTDKIATIAGIYNRFGFATVINFGTITPGGFQQRAVHLSDQSRLIEEASGVLQGTVVGSNSDQGVLELGAAAGNGAIAGIGDTITNFGTIDVDPGAEWAFSDDNLSKVKTLSCAGTIALASGEVVSVPSVTLAGAGAIVRATGATGTSVVNIGTLVRAGGAGASRIATSVDNAGTVLDAGGGLNIFGAVTGSGAWDIGAGAELSFRDGVAAGGTVAFAGANGTLQLADAAGFAGAVAGFGGGGETVDLSSIAFGSGVTLGWSGGPSGGALTVTSGTEVARIAFLGHYAPASFTASSDGGSGTDISFVAATKTISSGYPNGYTLAAGHYLTITSIGSIGGPGLLAETHATVTNSGRIAAAAGADSYSQASAGGVAATLVGSNVLANDKLIAGGRGGAGLFENVQPVGPTYGGSGAGGAGLKASSGTVVNYSTIRGGAGGYGHDGGGTGGGGVYLSSGVLTNRRWILGGAGGVSASVGGAGGVGAWISKATATNTGTIAGGAGGNGAAQHYGHGGVGVTLAASVLINGGSILGGAGGGSSPGLTQGNGVDVRGAASIINQAGGLIRGYIAIDNPGYGAVTVTNYGTISGYTCGVNFLQTAHSASDRLIEEGTGVLSGEVFGGGGTLELAAGAGTGTIGGLGGSILGFGHIAVDAGAGWHL
ncbi:MAG TPA: hypothetical protein VG166_05225, partial [Caulobacteraceae bacterium]|nr:hypothetical protein [Caulobacteraceae bacterium]